MSRYTQIMAAIVATLSFLTYVGDVARDALAKIQQIDAHVMANDQRLDQIGAPAPINPPVVE